MAGNDFQYTATKNIKNITLNQAADDVITTGPDLKIASIDLNHNTNLVKLSEADDFESQVAGNGVLILNGTMTVDRVVDRTASGLTIAISPRSSLTIGSALPANSSIIMAPGSSITASNEMPVTGEGDNSVTHFAYRDDASETVTCPAANQLEDLSAAMSSLLGRTVTQTNNANGSITFSEPTEVPVSGAAAEEEGPDV